MKVCNAGMGINGCWLLLEGGYVVGVESSRDAPCDDGGWREGNQDYFMKDRELHKPV